MDIEKLTDSEREFIINNPDKVLIKGHPYKMVVTIKFCGEMGDYEKMVGESELVKTFFKELEGCPH